MTLWRHLRKGAPQLIHKCGFWNGDPDFTLVFKKPSVNRAPFPINSTFTGSRYDIIALFLLGALQVTFGYGFWKGDPDFIWCLILTLRLPCTVSDIIGVIFSQKWRHNVNSARGCCKLSVYANSERATPTLYWYSMVTIHLSYTVSDIIRFYC